MNPDVALLVFQYRKGAITPQQFSAGMQEMNYSLPQIMQIIADVNNPRVREPNIPAPDGSSQGFSTNLPGPGQTAPLQQSQPQAQAEPQVQPQVRTESGTMVTPGYSLGPRFQLKDPEGETIPRFPYRVQRFENSGSPYIGSPYQTTEQMMAEQPNEPRVFPTIQRAVEVAKNRNAESAASQSQAATPSDLLHTLIRGRFGDAARGNPMDDRLTAFQEARDKSGDSRASGGAVNGKEAALHKALEIIHHLLRTR
jgi:hypothetical protein